MARTKLIYDYTSGSIPKQLGRFMLPFMGSNALQLVYSMVDMVIVGRYVGKEGLSAVSQGSMIIIFFTMFCLGFSNGGQIMIAQFVGADRKNQLKPLIGTLFSIMAIGGAVLTVLCLLLRGTLLQLMSVPPEAWDMARAYVTVCGGGLLFTVGFNAVSAILRGMGDSRHPFIFLAVSSLLNLILDYLLTGVLGLGVAGAAFATIFSQAVSRHNEEEFHFDFRLRSFRIHPDMLSNMTKLGIPLALQMVAINISMMICHTFINRLGVVASATFGVGVKVDDIGNKLTLGIQYAAGRKSQVGAVVGQHKDAAQAQKGAGNGVEQVFQRGKAHSDHDICLCHGAHSNNAVCDTGFICGIHRQEGQQIHSPLV